MNHAKNLADKLAAFQKAAEELTEAWSNASYSEQNHNGQIDDITSYLYPLESSFDDFVVIDLKKWTNDCISKLNNL